MEVIKKYWKPILAILTIVYLVWSIALISESKKHSEKAQHEKKQNS